MFVMIHYRSIVRPEAIEPILRIMQGRQQVSARLNTE